MEKKDNFNFNVPPPDDHEISYFTENEASSQHQEIGGIGGPFFIYLDGSESNNNNSNNSNYNNDNRIKVYDTILGEGFFCVVKKGYWGSRQKEVAIKILKPESSQFANVFKNDISIHSSIKNPSTEFYGTATTEGGLNCAVVELKTCSLYHLLSNRPSLLKDHEHLCIRIMLEIIKDMISLHKNGVIHKDIHSNNVLLEFENHQLLKDFSGFKCAGLSDFGVSQFKNQPNSFLGHVSCRAPEIVAHQQSNEMSDVFSLGNIFWDITQSSKYFLNQMEEPSYLRSHPFSPDTPSDWIEITNKCWSQNPQQRPTLDQLCGWLTDLLNQNDSMNQVAE